MEFYDNGETGVNHKNEYEHDPAAYLIGCFIWMVLCLSITMGICYVLVRLHQ